MASLALICSLYMLLLVKGIDMMTLNRVVERMNQLEFRLLSETKYRTEDMSILLSKLDDINVKLNKLTVSGEATSIEKAHVHTSSAIDNEQTVDTMSRIESQFLALRKGIEDEKRENRRTRRQVAAQQISLNELNKMPTLLERMVNQTAENTLKEIRKDIKHVHAAITSENVEMIQTMASARIDITEVHADLSRSINEMKDGITCILNNDFDVGKAKLSITMNEINEQIAEVKSDINNISQSLDRHMAIAYIKNNALTSNGSNTTCISETDISRQLLYRNARSCSDIKRFANISNVYDIYRSGERIEVFCDQQTDGGGWIMFQRRQDGSENFNRSWSDYKEGFGNLRGEFWLGNEYLHLLTNEDVVSCELRVDMTDFEGNTAFAKYSSFKIGSESDKYKLEVGGYSGTVGDSLGYHNRQNFQTYDNAPGYRKCARKYHGNWHDDCYRVNPNGIYFTSGVSTIGGIKWMKWKNESLKHIDMKFRCKQSR